MKILLRVVILLLIIPNLVNATDRIYPSDLTYSGAFILPDDVIDNTTLSNDGSRFQQMGYDNSVNGLIVHGKNSVITGAGMTTVVIPPTPVISENHNVNDLNEATFATGKDYFVDLSGGLQGSSSVGGDTTAINSTWLNDAEYLPAYGSQSSAKYHYVLRMDYSVGVTYNYRVGWSDTDFASLNSAGLWRLDGIVDRMYDSYMFKIDTTWADATPQSNGYYLGVGRGRTNGSFGPSLYAIKPWIDGNPPADQDSINSLELMNFTRDNLMETFTYADYYQDAVLLTSGTAGAFVVYVDKSFRHDGSCADCLIPGTTKWWTSAGEGRSIGYKSKDSASTTGIIDDSQTTIDLADASILSASGRVKTDNEIILYTGKSGNTLTGCVRGYNGTTAVQHGTVGTPAHFSQLMPDIYDYTAAPVDGYDTLFRIPMLLFFDLDEIAEVAAGTRNSYDVQPYAYMQLANKFWRSAQRRGENVTPQSNPGITWDDSGTVYIGEFDGVRNGYSRRTLIHVFSLSSGATADTAKPSDVSNVTVSSGNVTWTHTKGADDFYIIYKYFENAWEDVSEYRPIMSTISTSWTDPHYTEGDLYQVQVVDGSMNLSDRASSGEPPSTSKTMWSIGGSTVNWSTD